MVKEEKKIGNPIVGLIHNLHLKRNSITLLQSNNLDDMDEYEKTQPTNQVKVNLALSTHENECMWFEYNSYNKHIVSIAQISTIVSHVSNNRMKIQELTIVNT